MVGPCFQQVWRDTMKYKTLFRVLLKLLGVYFAGLGSFQLLSQTLNLFSFLSIRSGMPSSQYWFYGFSMVSAAVEIGFGLYLFFGGRWIVDKAIPGNRPYCHECGYDLTSAVGNVCNECGTPFRAPITQVAAVHE
jgi:hypothetical protein